LLADSRRVSIALRQTARKNEVIFSPSRFLASLIPALSVGCALAEARALVPAALEVAAERRFAAFQTDEAGRCFRSPAQAAPFSRSDLTAEKEAA
jgi:uncharacterized membrane protein YdfJ with MMPL/SSD domain